MNILSVQSHVAFGHVGNSVAVFALQRLGFEVWPVPTVLFSNHPGYGAWRGTVVEARIVRDMLLGIEERGGFAACDAVLSGYLGEADTGAATVEAVARVKRVNPRALYCCDPVIGDRQSGIYVRPGIAESFRDSAVPAADIVTPNHFELELLTGRPATDLRQTLKAVDALHARGPRIVVVTSVVTTETPPETIDLIVSEGTEKWRLRTPRLPLTLGGAGDLLAALFLGRYLRDRSAPHALSLATAGVFGVLERTLALGARELALIAAQEAFCAAPRRLPLERL